MVCRCLRRSCYCFATWYDSGAFNKIKNVQVNAKIGFQRTNCRRLGIIWMHFLKGSRCFLRGIEHQIKSVQKDSTKGVKSSTIASQNRLYFSPSTCLWATSQFLYFEINSDTKVKFLITKLIIISNLYIFTSDFF